MYYVNTVIYKIIELKVGDLILYVLDLKMNHRLVPRYETEYFSVPDKKEHFFINSYKNIYKFFKLDKLIWDGEVVNF